MTKEDIIRMAQEAGFDEWWDNGCSSWDTLQETFERFAALVAAAEREACAQLCEVRADEEIGMAYQGIALDCAAAIRARGEK